MKSIFRYPGGKTRGTIQRWILSHRPPLVREYREPFVGGGGVFFAIRPDDPPVRWVNDVNEGLTAVYRALAERPDEFIARCREVEPARPDDPLTSAGVKDGKPQNARLKAVFESVALDTGCDQAFRYFFVNRTVFGGRVNYDRPSRLYFSKPEGWDVISDDQLERAARWLAGVRITCGDFAPLFREPGDDVWVYADPPYVRNTGFTGNSKLYQHSFSVADHERLAAAVKACPHKVALSYDDTEFIRSLYPESEGFYVADSSWAYCGSTNGEKDRGRELLILNYEPPQRSLFTPPSSSLLTAEESGELARCEAAIEGLRRSFFEAGAALCVIRDRRLYRAGHQTFEDYCARRWGLTASYGRKCILATEARQVIAKRDNCPVLPGAEGQARELVVLRNGDRQLDQDRVCEAWEKVVRRAETERVPITAKLVREEVRSLRGLPAPVPADRVERLKRQIELMTEADRAALYSVLGVVPASKEVHP